MTKEEAKNSLEQGKVLTHLYFEKYEWVKKNASGKYEFEDGATIDPDLFWKDRQSDGWDDEWSLYIAN